MTDVSVVIHGRTYGVGCDEGQEKRVRELGQYIDRRVKEISGAGGAATEAHLLMLGCLVLADELFESREAQQQMRNQVGGLTREIEVLQNRVVAPAPVPAPVSASARPEELIKLQQQLFAANAQNKALQRQVDDLEEQLTAPPAPAPAGYDPETEAQIAGTMAQLTGRLEGIAKRLQAA